MSRIDLLTGLKDRTQLFQDLETSRAAQWILRVDLDDLIFVVDSSGPLVGDKAIVRTAEGLSVLAKELDGEAYRVGGDDFIVTFKNIDLGSIVQRLSALQDELQLSNFSFGTHPFRTADHLTASFLLIPMPHIPANNNDTFLRQITDLFNKETFATQIPNAQASAKAASPKRQFIAVNAAFDA